MKSTRPKVLHEVAGRSMLAHVLLAVKGAGATDVAVVIGPERDDVAAEVNRTFPEAAVFVQRERLGTAHAVLAARGQLEAAGDDVIVAYADTPLVTAATFAKLRKALAGGAAVAVLGFEARDPTGYGRLVRSGERLVAIREERDATPEERAITLSNAGLMALRGDVALSLLSAIGNGNAKGEYYLTDAVEVAVSRGEKAVVVIAPETEVQGVNDRAQLADAEGVLQTRMRAAAMAGGATLVVEPNVVFGPKVKVADGVVIRAFSHLDGATVASGAIVGPYARLRPGAAIGEGAHIGNFVEVKNAEMGAGAKANHLAYIGDASVGAGTNIGAGTITCNYDGFAKHRTTIGEGAFIGVNTALVAPVSVGDGAYIGTGSVITDDVPANALALGRARQVIKKERAIALRERFKVTRS
jgi:bifunctional UDP-N-acetylglucosamine pyrophosphorylase/glucosamine-1-phosphate N-acetyltransferase